MCTLEHRLVIACLSGKKGLATDMDGSTPKFRMIKNNERSSYQNVVLVLRSSWIPVRKIIVLNSINPDHQLWDGAKSMHVVLDGSCQPWIHIYVQRSNGHGYFSTNCFCWTGPGLQFKCLVLLNATLSQTFATVRESWVPTNSSPWLLVYWFSN